MEIEINSTENQSLLSNEKVLKRTTELFNEHTKTIYKRTDFMFAILMLIQWIVGIIFAVVISPFTWAGEYSQVHIHVLAAVFLGGTIVAFPLYLIRTFPGESLTRHVIAVSQMLYSALLIHLTGGRIETHFHVFGSLAFLAFYRDWRLLITASTVVALDHFIRGVYWPQSVFGILTISPYRWLEHAAWVIFEDIFLAVSIYQSKKEMWEIALRQASLRERTAQLERSNSDLEEFAYVTSHDLQEPLRKIIIFGDRLKSHLGNVLDDKGRDYLEGMQNGALRMRQLIEALLQLSRITREPNFYEPVNLEEIVKDVISDLEPRIQESRAKIEINKLPIVNADKLQMQELFLNLISNSIKFRKKGEAPHIVLSNKNLNEVSEITLEDNGIGFEEKYLNKIFKPFQRLHSRDEYEGSGIGLAICQKIVERHAWKISAKSEPNKGTKFIITLPK